jgi:hypothetical protein
MERVFNQMGKFDLRHFYLEGVAEEMLGGK